MNEKYFRKILSYTRIYRQSQLITKTYFIWNIKNYYITDL